MFGKNSIEKNFVFLFVIISLIPIILISICSISINVHTLRRQTEQETLIQLKSVDNAVYEKTKKIQRFIDNITVSEELINILENSKEQPEEFAELIDRLSIGNDEIKGVIFENRDKKLYPYRANVKNFDRLSIISAGMSREQGTITWYNIDDYSAHAGVGENLMIAAMTLNRFQGDKTYKWIANVYIFVDKSTFEDIIQFLSDDNIICILDDKGKLVSSNRKEEYVDIESDIDVMTKIFSESDGLFETNLNNGDFLFFHYSSPITGFKFIKVYHAGRYYRNVYLITILCALMLLVLLFIVVAIYIMISKKITKPIKILSDRMKNLNDHDLYKELTIPDNTVDEVTMITAGFNKMIYQIHMMLENAKTRERDKNDAEFRALRYQINPHFLYNTLATIRFMAIKNNENEISHAMLLLNRVLKNAFSRSETYVQLDEELGLVRDYTELLNLRYQNKLNITYDISDETMNCCIPTMLIQPLVENAVMHGLAKRLAANEENAEVCIQVKELGGCLQVVVHDNGCGIAEGDIERILQSASVSRHGIGLYNIRKRINILFGEKYGVTIRSVPEQYTDVIVTLPVQYSDVQEK